MTETNSVFTYGGFHPNYLEEKKYFEDCKVYTVQIEANLACPQGCLYCYASDENAPLKELPKKKIIEVLDSATNMEVKAVDWLGGDPLLRTDWYELMTYAINQGLTNNIWTSGLPLVDKEVAKKCVEVTEGGFISVHLDSLDEEIYGKLHTGNPKKKIHAILEGVSKVQELGKKPENMINCITFTKIVAKDVKKTIQYFFNQKGMRTCLTQMCMTGLATEHPEWIPSIEEIREACETRDESNYPKSTVTMCTMDTNKYYCGGTICVTIDGDVTPCSVIREGYGNIYHTSLEAIVQEHKDKLLLTHIRDVNNMPGYCSSCEHNSACWGCRATAYYEKGDILAEDPKCYINPRNYE